MSIGLLVRRAALAAGLLLGVASAAGAQTYANPNLPRSPYALPQPTGRDGGPDVDELIEGNGKLHFSGQWRHWGDKRNSGETFYQLFAPTGVLDLGQGCANGLPASRFCAANPDQC